MDSNRQSKAAKNILSLQYASFFCVFILYFLFDSIMYEIFQIDTELIKVDAYALRNAFEIIHPYKILFFFLNFGITTFLCFIFITKKDNLISPYHQIFKIVNIIFMIFMLISLLGSLQRRIF